MIAPMLVSSQHWAVYSIGKSNLGRSALERKPDDVKVVIQLAEA
jgi:hypothetical protein